MCNTAIRQGRKPWEHRGELFAQTLCMKVNCKRHFLEEVVYVKTCGCRGISQVKVSGKRVPSRGSSVSNAQESRESLVYTDTCEGSAWLEGGGRAGRGL